MTDKELESYCGNCPKQFKCMGGFDYFTLGRGVIKTDFECEHQTELAAYVAERLDYEIWKMIARGELK